MSKGKQVDHNVHLLCERAIQTLKAVGFERAAVSGKSEAVYMRFPGRPALLRVSTHPSKHSPIGMDYVAARLTFKGRSWDGHSVLRCSEGKIDMMIYLAIGQYFVKALTPKPSLYKGKRGTWEHLEGEAELA